MFQRSIALSLRRAATVSAPRAASFAVRRNFTVSAFRASEPKETHEPSIDKKFKTFTEIKSEGDLLGPGAAPGTVPTDLDQATGLERLEILGKMEGVDIFDMKPLDSSRKGTFENPITVQSYGEEQYLGCTGSPADSHVVTWLTVSHDRPFERCPECGSTYKMDYLGPPVDAHAHDHGHHDPHHTVHKDPETLADYVKQEYW